MIKVLHYGLNKNRGGIETYLDKIWTHINKDKFKFDFIDEWKGQACFRKKFETMGSVFYEVEPRSISILNNRHQIKEILMSEKPDVLHCHLNTLSYVTPIFLAYEIGIPVIVHSRSAGASFSIVTNLLHIINKRRIQKLSRIVRLAVSTKAGDWLFGNGNQFRVINNGIDAERFKFSYDLRANILSELNVMSGTFIVGTVGSISYPKNQLFLVDIFREIKRRVSNSILIIAGEGPLITILKKRISNYKLENSVFILGNRSDIPSLLSAMDVFILPSIFEGFPNAALEAQASGLPCFLSDNITKEIGINNCWFLPLSHSPEIWSNKILEKLEKNIIDRSEANDMIEKAGLSIKNEISSIEDIYSRMSMQF